ncbi:hypothetical protein [Nonomuraea sp. KM88]|uniref:hypothetical protein n=1 Tax=Nonomuraea sp. KM88 TaxID=3457427 RepID=UPI003FCE4006
MNKLLISAMAGRAAPGPVGTDVAQVNGVVLAGLSRRAGRRERCRLRLVAGAGAAARTACEIGGGPVGCLDRTVH